MNITEDRKDGTVTVHPEGRMDTLNARELEAFVTPLLEEAQAMVFDLEKVDYISSAGIRVLILAYKAMKEKDGLTVCNVSPQVRETLELTGYSHVLRAQKEAGGDI